MGGHGAGRGPAVPLPARHQQRLTFLTCATLETEVATQAFCRWGGDAYDYSPQLDYCFICSATIYAYVLSECACL